MVKAFEIAGYDEQTVIDRFGGMYRAFHYGAPPHGGMAAGVDRIIMLLAGEQNLRSKCTPSTSASVVRTSSVPRSGAMTAASSPT